MMLIIVWLGFLLQNALCSMVNHPVETPDTHLQVNPASGTIASKLRHNHNRAVPQSLTLLMNFKDDGTTTFQIMQGSQTIYIDSGLCKYGQTFDATSGRCRDVYCQDTNDKYNGTTCIPDESINTTSVYKRMSDIDLALSVMISPSSFYERQPGNFSKRLNSQMNATCTGNWAQMFHNMLDFYLDIDYERIIKIDYRLKEPGEVAQINNTQSSSTKAISDALKNNRSATVDFYFTITDRNEASNDTMTGLHVVTLLLLASEHHLVVDMCQDYAVKVESVSFLSDKNKSHEEFCNDPDRVYQTTTGIFDRRFRSDGEIDYVVYVPELDTTYGGGDYTYLFIVSTHTQLESETKPMLPATTPISSQASQSAIKLVTLCNRAPRIVDRCPDSLVMRIALCEVIQYTNFSIRIKRTNRLYSNREYRFDHLRPDVYVVVCKHDVNATAGGKKLGFVEKAPGFVSTIATFLSIAALATTLLTFALFSSLRNLPGCNTINLILALMIAEILFLSQSLLIMTRPSVCLLLALGIHFFFLASFFWMNVMAFDLWKTFHKGFVLYVCEIRERLPFYALYAWGMPVVIVTIGVILDAKNAKMKPCYGRFFRGCYDVCFRTKNDTPLQGCWIESALMRFLLFGVPVAIILIVNFIFYALTVRSIRRGLKSVRMDVERKFQRKKQVVPGEHDVKIYMRMAALAGFGWTIGFILFALPDGSKGFQYYLVGTFKYLFILLNATPGLFIFAVYVCNRRVLSLYSHLFTQLFKWIQFHFLNSKQTIVERIQIYTNRSKEKFNEKLNNNNNKNIDPNHKDKHPNVNPTTKTPLTRLLNSQRSDDGSIQSNATYRTLLTSSREHHPTSSSTTVWSIP